MVLDSREPAALIPIEERSMTIDDIKNAVKDVAVEFPISRTVLFGSRANGTYTPESDVDLIMEFNAPVTLITISKTGLKVFLKQMLILFMARCKMMI